MDINRERRYDGEVPHAILAKMKTLYDQGISFEKIAFEIGCVSSTYVRNRAKKYGWTREQSARDFTGWSDDKDRLLMSLKSEGKTWPQIGAVVGKTHQACERRYQTIKNSMHARDPDKYTDWQHALNLATSRPWK